MSSSFLGSAFKSGDNKQKPWLLDLAEIVLSGSSSFSDICHTKTFLLDQRECVDSCWFWDQIRSVPHISFDFHLYIIINNCGPAPPKGMYNTFLVSISSYQTKTWVKAHRILMAFPGMPGVASFGFDKNSQCKMHRGHRRRDAHVTEKLRPAAAFGSL